jgi:hypothetical protein
MLDNHETTEPTTEPLDLIWGCAAIAKTIGLSERRTFYLLATKRLPARKIGSLWVASRSNLHRHLAA